MSRTIAPLAAFLLLSLFVFAAHGSDKAPVTAKKTEAAKVARPPKTDPKADKPCLRISAVIEAGFLAVLDHTIQFSKDGTRFDYRADGGQDLLFFNQRFSVEVDLCRGHSFVLLYQPLRIATQTTLTEDTRIDGLDFPAGTNMDLLYDFPFYRVSYQYDFLSPDDCTLAVGFSLQLRNANISFRSADGSLFRENRSLGPVPLLKLRGRAPLGEVFWAELELDCAYISIRYLNGGDSDVEGALVDLAGRLGARFGRVEAFLTVRYLGGGASGTNENETGPGDGYVNNWLHFLVLTAGMRVSVF